MKKQIHLLFGVGEVGSAIKKILKPKTTLFWFDINPSIKNNLPKSLSKIDVLHITFPQNGHFVISVKKIIKKYSPELTVIHSTTIPGTTEKFGPNCVHSPIVGQHDNLYKHIKTFRKAIGPNSPKAERLAKKYLSGVFELELYGSSIITEAAKVLSLAKFAINIEMARYSDTLCKNLNIDYSQAYTKFSKLYNDGYQKNKLEKFIQPLLVPPKGKIGGTCVIPGVKKAHVTLKSKFLNDIIKRNGKN